MESVASHTAAFELRPFEPGDTSFLFKSWLDSYRYSDWGLKFPSPVFYAGHHDVIERIVSRRTTDVTVACDPSSPSVLYGFAVTERPNCIHYVYVKRDARRFGICSALLASASYLNPSTVELSHACTGEWHRCLKKHWGSRWNPYRTEGYPPRPLPRRAADDWSRKELD